jgi:type II secretory pathway component PulF
VSDFDATRLVSRLKTESKKNSGRAAFVFKRLFLGLSMKSLEQFFFQLTTMLSSGVTIRESLHTLSGQHSRRASRYFREAADEVQAGRPLSGALERRPYVWGRFAVAMVKAGEEGGGLDTNVGLVAKQIEAFRRLRSSVITALLYPVVLLHLGVLILNLPTLLGPNGGVWKYLDVVFVRFLIPIYVACVVLFILHQILRQTLWYSEFILSLFLFGGVARKSALARFSRSLATLYEAGVPLGHGVEISVESAENGAIRKSLVEATRGLESGHGLSESLAQAKHLPPMVHNMIATGEHTGSLGVTLRKVADFYEHEAETAVKRMAKIIPIFIYLSICGYFAYQIITFYLDRYEGFFS